ncbi:MAG: hypothetical protein ACYTBJ_17310 [Planctomycetota bacterium]|jgi:hypothetical protein
MPKKPSPKPVPPPAWAPEALQKIGDLVGLVCVSDESAADVLVHEVEILVADLQRIRERVSTGLLIDPNLLNGLPRAIEVGLMTARLVELRRFLLREGHFLGHEVLRGDTGEPNADHEVRVAIRKLRHLSTRVAELEAAERANHSQFELRVAELKARGNAYYESLRVVCSEGRHRGDNDDIPF